LSVSHRFGVKENRPSVDVPNVLGGGRQRGEDPRALLESEPAWSAAELARRAYRSFATAWQVKRDFELVHEPSAARTEPNRTEPSELRLTLTRPKGDLHPRPQIRSNGSLPPTDFKPAGGLHELELCRTRA